MARRAYRRFCPIALALEEVGDRWTLLIIAALLLKGPQRYSDLKAFLAGAGSNVLGDRLRRLADAQVVGRSAGDRPGSEVTYQLTERGMALAPVIQGLAEWGLASLTLSAPASASQPDREVFDQTWAIPNADLVVDEVYQWTVDGVEFELAVSGCTIARSRGPARDPIVTLTTTSSVLQSLLSGERTLADAEQHGDLQLTGPRDAARRMFMAIGVPSIPIGL